VRAVPGGAGEAKAAGNYGAALLPTEIAQKKGFDQIMWLDGYHFKEVQEVGTMNLFFVFDGKVVTPELNGAILKGITRDSFITILKDKGYEVEERTVTIDEIVEQHKAGKLDEIFGAGTAAVVAHVSSLTYKDYLMELPPVENRKVGEMLKTYINNLRAGTIEDKFGWIVPVGSEVNATIGH
jgi:branched-chain amino acid aminotransferase